MDEKKYKTANAVSQDAVVIPLPNAAGSEKGSDVAGGDFDLSRSTTDQSDGHAAKASEPHIQVSRSTKEKATGRGFGNTRFFSLDSGSSKSRQKSSEDARDFTASRSSSKGHDGEHSLRREASVSSSRRHSKRLKDVSGRMASADAEEAASVQSGHRSLRSQGSHRSLTSHATHRSTAATEGTLGSRMSKSSVFTNYTESDATFRRAYSTRVLGAHPDLNRMSKNMMAERAESIREINALDRVVSVSETGRFYYIHESAGVLDGRSFQAGPDLIFVDDITLGVEMKPKEARKLTLVDYIRVAGIGVVYDDLTRCDEEYGKLHGTWRKKRNEDALVVGSIGMDVVLLPGEAKFYERSLLDDFGMVVVASWLSEEFSIEQLKDFKYALRRERKQVQKEKNERVRELMAENDGGDGEALHTVIDKYVAEHAMARSGSEQDRTSSAEPVDGFAELLKAIEQRLECVRNATEAVEEYERQELEEQKKLYQPRSVASALGLADSSDSEEIEDKDEEGGFDRYERYENFESEDEDEDEDEEGGSDPDDTSKLEEQLKMPFAKFIALQAKMKKSQSKLVPVVRRVPSVKSERATKSVSFKDVLLMKKSAEPEPAQFYGDPRLLSLGKGDQGTDSSVLRDPARFAESKSGASVAAVAHDYDSDDDDGQSASFGAVDAAAAGAAAIQAAGSVDLSSSATVAEKDSLEAGAVSAFLATSKQAAAATRLGGEMPADAAGSQLDRTRTVLPASSFEPVASQGQIPASVNMNDEGRPKSIAERRREIEARAAEIGKAARGSAPASQMVAPSTGGISVAERQKQLEGRELANLVKDNMKIEAGLGKRGVSNASSSESSSVSGSIGELQLKLGAQKGFVRKTKDDEED
ncbi:hypothetical protein FVE85_7021 [Porphyridium purpureum]|uniref:Uncharacterized protein n=1 Tax=Porphyridium purpureum TaxID=35688 RepID=A0A5J4Z6U3_PORPP|nr:hypothetical protein FVE85_7021 [Porphyridium purpureum]|eukprot:POR3237..scf295_1